jgi:putative FmdB family regulatory protein
MPIYGYRCRSCGHEFEVLQKMSDAPLQTCPKCSGQLAKIVYPAGVIYKGSGYYSTDYKGGGKAAKAAGNGSSSDSDKTSSDSKPEGKPEGKPAGESKSESKTSGSSSSE